MLFLAAILLIYSGFKEHNEYDSFWNSPMDWVLSAGSRFVCGLYLLHAAFN